MATELNIEQGLFLINTSFQAWASEVYDTGQAGVYSEYTQTLDGDGASRIEQHFLTNTPRMREWTGARRYKQLRHYSQSITYKDYEATLPIKTRTVDMDAKGIVASLLPAFTGQLDSYDETVGAQFYLSSGVGPTGFDGVVLFSASHPHSDTGGNQSNIGAGTNLSHVTLAAAEAIGNLWKQENGRFVRPNFTRMHVAPNIKRRAMELLSADRVVGWSAGDAEGGTTVDITTRSNTFEGDKILTVDPQAGNTYYWTLIDDTKGPVRPMVLFIAQPITASQRTAPEDPHVWEHREYLYGCTGRWGIGAGHWYTCYRGTGTA